MKPPSSLVWGNHRCPEGGGSSADERVKPSEDIDFTKTNDSFSTNAVVVFSLKGVLLSEEKDAAIIETGSRTTLSCRG